MAMQSMLAVDRATEGGNLRDEGIVEVAIAGLGGDQNDLARIIRQRDFQARPAGRCCPRRSRPAIFFGPLRCCPFTANVYSPLDG